MSSFNIRMEIKYLITMPLNGNTYWWTPSNPSTIYPKAATNRNILVNDRFVEDGSFLKLKTLSLFYSFPKVRIKHIYAYSATRNRLEHGTDSKHRMVT